MFLYTLRATFIIIFIIFVNYSCLKRLLKFTTPRDHLEQKQRAKLDIAALHRTFYMGVWVNAAKGLLSWEITEKIKSYKKKWL